MLLPELAYERPVDVPGAVRALAAHPNARVLAGGQTLLNALKLRLAAPDVLVDVSRLPELRAIDVEADGSLSVGAAVTYAEVTRSEEVRSRLPVLARVCARLVDRQVRARGTIGGNVCLADPTSNLPPLLVALDAVLDVRDQDGPQEIPAQAFFLAPYLTAAGPGRLLERVRFRALGPGCAAGYESLQVGTDSWALARACAFVDAADAARTRVVLGCAAVPVRYRELEEALRATDLDLDAVGPLPAAIAGFDPPSDVHASADYRRAMAQVMARRAVQSALLESRRRG